MCTQRTIDKINSGKLIAVPKWTSIFNYISLPLAITVVFYMGFYKNDIDSRIFKNAKEKDNFVNNVDRNTEHRLDKTLHMSYKVQTELFVPRTEIEYKFDIFMANQEKIMDKLNIN